MLITSDVRNYNQGKLIIYFAFVKIWDTCINENEGEIKGGLKEQKEKIAKGANKKIILEQRDQ